LAEARAGRLAGLRVAIAGGSGGIGLAIAGAVQREGATPLIGGRDADRRAAAIAALPLAEEAELDAASEASAERFLEAVAPAHHLVVTLGPPETPPRLFRDGDVEEARRHFDAAFWPAFTLARAFARHVSADPACSLLFVTGGLSRRPIPGKSLYTAAQSGLHGLALALVEELAPVRVNVLIPGLVRSPRWDAIDPAGREALFEQAAGEVPVGFIPDAAPVAAAAVEMLANPYLSGSSLAVDGGWTRSI
jgi:NAD(P)-dependent dehydrogenase (short-subunit alcohol dehydrogenase family)